VKVKVGIGDDAGRLAAVRAAVGPEVGIRVDANGAWGSPAEALANLRALEPVGLELCEEPVHGVEALREVQAGTRVPIAMDETHAPGSGATRAVCLKITRGGITGVLADARAARATGADIYLASTFDGPRGLAAGVHVAAALRITRSCGFATGGLSPHDGVIDVPMTAGLA
jgi:L-alanine-DL-glutamate epimerase-like enolase superfamily enzyme